MIHYTPDAAAHDHLATIVGHAHDQAVQNGRMGVLVALTGFSSLWEGVRSALPPWSLMPPLMTSLAGLLLAAANFRRAFWSTSPPPPQGPPTLPMDRSVKGAA